TGNDAGSERTTDRVRPVISLELVISDVVVGRAMEATATTFGRGTDLHRAGAMLSSVVAGLNLYFLHHVRVRGDDRSVVGTDIDHARTVNRDIVLFAAKTIDVVLSVCVSNTTARNALQRGVVGSQHTGQDP